MTLKTLAYGLAILLGALRAHAACDTLDLSTPRQLQVGSDIPAQAKKVFLVGVVEQFLWDVEGATLPINQQKLDQLSTAVGTESAEVLVKNRLEFRGVDGKAIGERRCIAFPTTMAAVPPARATVPAAGAAPPRGILFEDCLDLVLTWAKRNMTPRERFVAFNSAGKVCARDPRTVAQGDPIVAVVAVKKDELQQSFLPADYSPCGLRAEKTLVLNSVKDIPIITFTGGPQYTEDKVLRVGTRACYDDNTVVTLKKQDGAGAAVTLDSTTVQQYKRFYATVQLGVLNSDTRDTSFGLRSTNGQNLIFDKGPNNHGPEYTASVLLYGLPRYFTEGLDYQGRDPVNENSVRDRIGVVLSAGLKDPGNRFGLGLSFEVARGVNLVVVHEWVRVTRLAGLNVGDAFTGAADTLPTRKTWDQSTAVGLSFDLAYVTQLFTRN
jgi:hypothetical protein